MLIDVPAGTPIAVGDNLVPMPEVGDGDRVVVVPRTGEILVVGEEARNAASEAAADARQAFDSLEAVADIQISEFFRLFAAKLADNQIWGRISEANAADVADAREAGRSTTRLEVSEKMRTDMIAGLAGWADAPTSVGEVVESRETDDYLLERRRAPLGVVAFVFEGRPNVFADGAGVVRNRNTAVMRIGGDALGTALEIEKQALGPALTEAGLPEAAVRLVRSRERAAGQALFTLPEVRLAVARGSGTTVALLGSIAEQHGIPASLHGTGGAWVYVDETATAESVENVISASLDRKVCNTLNVLVLDTRARETHGRLVSNALSGLGAKVHVAKGSEGVIAPDPTDTLPVTKLGIEWEWEDTPELSFVLADGLDTAARLINEYSPHFVASIVTSRPGAFEEFYSAVDAPYIGKGFTRWVDGQWAWERPELGLTNWERGRLLGRSGILSGDDIVTIRDVFVDKTGSAPQSR